MPTKDYVIEKIKSMPEDVVSEIGDFIDFLEEKYEKNKWKWLEKNPEQIAEDDFKDYLKGIEKYEEMLIKGEIRWK